jgi:ubiquinone/menaquinone biosynthesis C-methylase UbiE
MSERAHPDDAGFKDRYIFELKKGFFPWVKRYISPWKKEFNWRYKWVNQYCNGKEIIDIPCGMGWGTSFLTNAKCVIGIDISEDAIQEANQRYSNNKMKFLLGDMSNLNFDNESIDVISCLEGIEHVPKEVGILFINECFRILKNGGLFLISSPYCKTKIHSGNPFHIHEYQPKEILDILGQMFNIEITAEREVGVMNVLYIKCQK